MEARFSIGAGVELATSVQPYERKTGDPMFRPLRIFTLDPTVSAGDGAVTLAEVPYEPLPSMGPKGCVLEVDVDCAPVDLDSPAVLIRNGLAPSSTDPAFHQQMVYAVASRTYAVFRNALGRHLSWGFSGRLKLKPHIHDLQNAYYDRASGSISFGYYPAPENAAGGIPPGSLIYTCLSHDIIVHEMTHAVLDGLRSHFLIPTNPDVRAFHEGFADLTAIFQHFTYPAVLEQQMQKHRGQIGQSVLLTGIAREFGYSCGSEKPLRSSLNDETYGGHLTGPYERGSVLVSAIFAAFCTIFERKTDRFLRLATNGTGILNAGRVPADLVSVLAKSAASLAGQFLNICIRAIDYCPPVDITFGEYLRALITADHDLVPDDKWAYREAIIDAFAKRRIFPGDVLNLSEDALLWQPPRTPVPPIKGLEFGALRFAGDPASPASVSELRRQASILGRYVSHPENLDNFGLAPQSPGFELPCVQSIRTSRRVGPSGEVLFDLIAEITQRAVVPHPDSGVPMEFHGGVTLVIDPKGVVRYTVLKHIGQTDRRRRQFVFNASDTPSI